MCVWAWGGVGWGGGGGFALLCVLSTCVHGEGGGAEAEVIGDHGGRLGVPETLEGCYGHISAHAVAAVHSPWSSMREGALVVLLSSPPTL